MTLTKEHPVQSRVRETTSRLSPLRQAMWLALAIIVIAAATVTVLLLQGDATRDFEQVPDHLTSRVFDRVPDHLTGIDRGFVEVPDHL